MKIKLTLSRLFEDGDIPSYEITNEKEILLILKNWLDTTEIDSTFVCFESFENVEYKDEHPTFLVSNNKDDIKMFIVRILDEVDFNFNIFEFENYEEAFNYCIDLKEGL